MFRGRTLEDEVVRSRFQIVRNVIDLHKEYFKKKVEIRLESGNSFSVSRIDEAFFDIIIEDEKEDVFKWVKEEIHNNQEIAFAGAENFQQFLSFLLKQCVEKEKTVALKKVLEWFQTDIAPIHKVSHLLLDWDWKADWSSDEPLYIPKWNGLTGNSEAMIRACEKDDFEMVSIFMDFKYPLKNNAEAIFRIDDREFKPCEQDEKQKWKNHSKRLNKISFPLTTLQFLREEKDILLDYRNSMLFPSLPT